MGRGQDVVVAYNEALRSNLLAGTEENHDNPQ
jgi:hypothetical protein